MLFMDLRDRSSTRDNGKPLLHGSLAATRHDYERNEVPVNASHYLKNPSSRKGIGE